MKNQFKVYKSYSSKMRKLYKKYDNLRQKLKEIELAVNWFKCEAAIDGSTFGAIVVKKIVIQELKALKFEIKNTQREFSNWQKHC